MRMSLIRKSDSVVVNVMEMSDDSIWRVPDGYFLMDKGEIGQTWNGRKFIDPEPPQEPEPPRDLEAEIDDIDLRVSELEKQLLDDSKLDEIR